MIVSGHMLRTRLLARAITAALLISAACGPSNVAKPPTPQAPGSPTGDPNRGTVGDGGGSVTSRGGGLVVAVPAGATAAPVEISITEITNTAPHGVGRAYRLGPEGTRFTAPVALIFRADPDASLSDLTIATQDATGYWVRVSNVRRDPTAHTIVATTTHFSDWALVVAPSERDLSGIFRIASTRDGVVANGVTRFYFESSDEVSDYFYLQSGRITAETPISRPGATCQPLVATKDVGPNIGEIHLGDANPFIWGATGIWDLTCTPTAGGPQTQDFGSVVFENLGLNYPRCTRSYLAPPLVQPEDVQGSYQINCGAEGTINADWHFQRCVPGEVCQTANTCKTAAINCDSGLPLCVENGNVTNGTVCDVNPTAPYEVCGDGVCNVCRIDEACTPTQQLPRRHDHLRHRVRGLHRRRRVARERDGLRHEPGLLHRDVRRLHRRHGLLDEPEQLRRRHDRLLDRAGDLHRHGDADRERDDLRAEPGLLQLDVRRLHCRHGVHDEPEQLRPGHDVVRDRARGLRRHAHADRERDDLRAEPGLQRRRVRRLHRGDPLRDEPEQLRPGYDVVRHRPGAVRRYGHAHPERHDLWHEPGLQRRRL